MPRPARWQDVFAAAGAAKLPGGGGGDLTGPSRLMTGRPSASWARGSECRHRPGGAPPAGDGAMFELMYAIASGPGPMVEDAEFTARG
ncbi:hypothetical protein [Rhodococcus sp. IEGM 1307]|uniref:hypothetical protein n=1 Tax=Rhodococcus sp. IEGM 1307 TaxID=3047091 RepID=UPI0024B83B2D|nr:hypothetical protein [Rhodococcus sp. IEGM 1307]MDI9980061.1 hypothetical protein [Rhodococcus sp. IEGM 1307]